MQKWFYINPRSGVPIYVQIKEQIKTAVGGGVLEPGQQLPSVRELAVALVVNPNTVVRAYNELEHEGLLRIERGKGTFVADGKQPLREAERFRRLESLIDRVLVEAYHLKIPPRQVEETWNGRFQSWRERLAAEAGEGEA